MRVTLPPASHVTPDHEQGDESLSHPELLSQEGPAVASYSLDSAGSLEPAAMARRARRPRRALNFVKK